MDWWKDLIVHCDMLACYVNEDPEAWDVFLLFVTFAFNTAEQATIKNNPFYLFYGREANLPNELVENTRYRFTEDDIEVYKQKWQTALAFAKEHLIKAQAKQKEYYDVKTKVLEYSEGDYVLLRSPPVPGKFQYRWLGPYVVIQRISQLTYRIQLPGANESVVVHVNRLKRSPPPGTIEEVPVEQPHKERGRPRKLAGHPKKAKVVTQLRRPMTVIPIEVTDPPKERRKPGRPRKNPIVVNETVGQPKRCANESNQATLQNEYQWRPQGQSLGMPGFQQGITTVPPSLYNQFAPLNSPTYDSYTPHLTNQPLYFYPSQPQTNNQDYQYNSPSQPEILRYNLRKTTKQANKF
jgi:hypothetical protein